MKMNAHVLQFFKNDTVLCIAAVLAVGSAFIVKPDAAYGSYIDVRTLALLLCLMTVMQGFQRTGLFEMMARKLLGRVHHFRQLLLSLVGLCFFASMWMTNDVALITFVPFTILTLSMTGLESEMIPVIVLETIAANLGSMLTPVGNPQNLYLYSVSGMGMMDFLKVMAPLSGISLVMIVGLCLIHKNQPIDTNRIFEAVTQRKDKVRFGRTEKSYENMVLAMLFLLSLLTVFRVIHWPVLLAVTLAVCLLITFFCHEVYLPLKVDYSLLLTFVAFFIFIGNMGRIEMVRSLLRQILDGRELLISFFSSQIISNVPATILLSGFTDHYRSLLQGVNIGGLGTLIASMASLISYKLFAAQSAEHGRVVGSKKAYIGYFTLLNVGMAIVLLIAVGILNRIN